MKYSAQEVMQYAREADVKMIRLAFCNVYGKQKDCDHAPGAGAGVQLRHSR